MIKRGLIIVLSLFLGAIAVLGLSPWSYWPFQILSFILIFLMVLKTEKARNSALIGWAYGVGWSLCTVHWLYVSMHFHGGLAPWMAALAVLLMALVLGAFSALAFGLAAKLRARWQLSSATAAVFLLPACWALSEWLRGWVLTGLPWGASGYAHVESPLAGFAPILGVYGTGWLAALVAGCVLAVFVSNKKKYAVLSGVFLIALLCAGQTLKGVSWTQKHGEPIRVRLLQTNIPQEAKFSSHEMNAMLDLNKQMLTENAADLIATPETAIPVFLQQLPLNYLADIDAYAKKTSSHLLVGAPLYDGPKQYTNSVIGFASASLPIYRYDKHHLVPFGEFAPWGTRWFVNMMHIPLGEFKRGKDVQAPFAVKDQFILPNICYEDLFGEEIAHQIKASAKAGNAQPTILLNMSNIAWFGDTIALPQHLQISQMRALEMGRPMLRSTNTGMTAVINQHGEVISQLPAYTRGTLQASVQGYRGLTPYVRFGNILLLILIAASLAGGLFFSSRDRSGNIWR